MRAFWLAPTKLNFPRVTVTVLVAAQMPLARITVPPVAGRLLMALATAERGYGSAAVPACPPAKLVAFMVGAAVSIVTVTVAVAEPFEPVQVTE